MAAGLVDCGSWVSGLWQMSYLTVEVGLVDCGSWASEVSWENLKGN